MSASSNVTEMRRPAMYQERQYAVTLAATAASLDAFEDALDSLPDAVLIGSDETGCAALVFTVAAADPGLAAQFGLSTLRNVGLDVPDGSSLTVLEHETEGAA